MHYNWTRKNVNYICLINESKFEYKLPKQERCNNTILLKQNENVIFLSKYKNNIVNYKKL